MSALRSKLLKAGVHGTCTGDVEVKTSSDLAFPVYVNMSDPETMSLVTSSDICFPVQNPEMFEPLTLNLSEALATHRPLPILIGYKFLPPDQRLQHFDLESNAGCSDIYNCAASVGIRPQVYHGAAWRRQLLPPHGPVRDVLGYKPEGFVFDADLGLHGDGKRDAEAAGLDAESDVTSQDWEH